MVYATSYFATGLLLLLLTVPASVGGFPAVVTAVPDPLQGLRQQHPRLLCSEADLSEVKACAKRERLLARLIEQNERNARAMLGQPPVRYEIPDGLRLLGQSRRCIERVLAMALAYRLSGRREYARGAIREMLVAASFKDWNPRHFLDTAEMTTALALGYDWLYDQLSDSERRQVRAAIVSKGLEPGLAVYKRGGWWTRAVNNWNQVCNGGMVLGALAIADEEPELARAIISHALNSIPLALSVYKPSGSYPEGPGYWQYGTSYTCLTIAAFRSALGHDFGLSDTPGLSLTGYYRIHTLGPTGLLFNYADCGSGSRPASAMFFLSRNYGNGVYAWWHRRQLKRTVRASGPLRPRRIDRFFPLEIVWYDASGRRPTADELPLDAFFDGQQDVVTMRSDWDSDSAVYFAIKAGDNRANHGHLDIGSFVLDAHGLRWAVDLGPDNYNLPGYFGRQRWRYFRLTNLSHNTLVIDGRIQNTSAHCDVVSFHSSPERVCAVLDLTDAYRGQASRVLRGVQMLGRSAVHIRDELEAATGTVRWALVTPAEVSIDGAVARLEQRGRAVTVRLLAPSGEFKLLPTKPPTREERQNAGTRMLALEVRPGRGAKTVISVLIQCAAESDIGERVLSEPLGRWPQ
jgi:hypothetical protein